MRGVIAGVTLIAVFMLVLAANATWKPEYAELPQSVRDWYPHAQLTPSAHKRLDYTYCCNHADVVKTQFRVDRALGEDQWYWLKDGNWERVPDDIIHWGESAPDGQATLFVYNNTAMCFWPPLGGG